MGVLMAYNRRGECICFHFIEYMTQCGFPLPIEEVLGHAYCIAKQRGEGGRFQ